MKKLVFLTVFIPFFALCQQECFTETNILNADSVTYCIESASCHSICDGKIIITVFGANQPYFFEWGSSWRRSQGLGLAQQEILSKTL